MAHKWARCYITLAALGGSRPFQSGRQNKKWPTSGQGGYITPTAWGGPHRFGAQGLSEVAHEWARWLRHPCRLGGSQPLQSAGQNQRWPTSGEGGYITPAARGVPKASWRGAQSEVAHKLASGYITAWGIPSASQRGTESESEVAHKWARWLNNPCRLGGPHRFRAGGRITGGPQADKVAT